MRNWWKYLTVILLLYTIVFSLAVPLGGSIISADKTSLKAGSNSDLTITFYNTDFPSPHRCWIMVSDSNFLCAEKIEFSNEKVAEVDFNVPDTFPSGTFDLFFQTESDGKMVFPNAGFITTDNKDTSKRFICASANAPMKFIRLTPVFPNRHLLNESIRNLMFHVPMWFAMMLLFSISVFYSLKYLSTFNLQHDIIAKNAINVGILLGILGLATGSLWARFTWGNWWTNDVKLNGAAITTLVYLAYAVLRGSINEEQQRAKISAVYNIFAFVIMIVMLMILPRMTDSLHPGNGGNPAFSSYDLDSTLRMVFYPAVLGWMGISLWLLQIRTRINKIENALS